MAWYFAITGTLFAIAFLLVLVNIARMLKRKHEDQYGWAMRCTDCDVEMPVSELHARMVWDLAMKTKSWPTPRCPKCAASFTWKREEA